MSLSTYAGLQAAITGIMNITASDISSQIADVITLGETRISREARTKDGEKAYATAIASGVLAVPSDYVEMKYLYCSAAPNTPLERRSVEWLYSQYPRVSASSGVPRYFARDATNFVFGPTPDGSYTVTGCYYQKFAALSTSTNAQFLANPDLYLFACLAESEYLIGRDSRVPLWEAKYNKILQDANGLRERENISGSTPRMRNM